MKNKDAKIKVVYYVHGKGGNAGECEHYLSLFPECDVIGADYHGNTPHEISEDIEREVRRLDGVYDEIILVSNSIGAYYCMNAGISDKIAEAFFISPLVDMERMITDLMGYAGIDEATLERLGEVDTDFGEKLSREYLCYVRTHQLSWNAPTHVLYGQNDTMIPVDTIELFVRDHDADLTVMPQGEHWFHTDQQMRFLDDWIKSKRSVLSEICALRRWRKSDAHNLARILNNDRVQKYLGMLPFPYTESDGEKYLDIILNVDADTTYCYAIVAEGRVVGNVGAIRGEGIRGRSADIGYYLDEEYWGSGIMTASVGRLAEYLFAHSDLIRLSAIVFADNKASGRVLEKCGFVQEGYLKSYVVKHDKAIDVLIYAKIKSAEFDT